jgi:hypothetical protein
MPQLIFLLILVGGGILIYRKFISDAKRLQAKSREVEKERQTGAIGTLVKDEKTGEYRPRRDDEQ